MKIKTLQPRSFLLALLWAAVFFAALISNCTTSPAFAAPVQESIQPTSLTSLRVLGVSGSVTVKGYFVSSYGVRVGASFSGTALQANGTNAPRTFTTLAGLTTVPQGASGVVVTSVSASIYYDVSPAPASGTDDFKANYANYSILTTALTPAVFGRGGAPYTGNGFSSVGSAQLPAALDGSGYLKIHEQGTAAVSAASLPLPSGASTSALQGSTNTLLGGGLPSALDSSGALKVTALPTTSGGTTPFYSLDITTTSSQVKATAGQVYGWSFTNNNTTTTLWVKFYNATTATSASTPVFVLAVPPSSGKEMPNGAVGIAFSTAICIRGTTGRADNDNNAPTAGDLTGSVFKN